MNDFTDLLIPIWSIVILLKLHEISMSLKKIEEKICKEAEREKGSN